MTTKSIKECLDIERFTPVFGRLGQEHLPVGYLIETHYSVYSDGWLAGDLRRNTFMNAKSRLDFKIISQVIPRELML